MTTFTRSLAPVLKVLGAVVGIFALAMLVPRAFDYFTDEGGLVDYDAAILISFFGGIALWWATRPFRRELHPRSIAQVTIGGRVIESNVIFAVLAFMLIYGAAITWLSLLMLASGLGLVTAFTAVFACINDIGPGLNPVGPTANYAGLNDFETWVCTFAMLIGRLELLSVLLTPAFWRK